MEEFLQRIEVDPEKLEELPPLFPPDLVAFVWTVTEDHGEFHERKIIERGDQPTMHLAFFTLPRVGSYKVRLRVVFSDGRFGERTVTVDFRDWFIVSLGDSSASGEGNPDVPGETTSSGQNIL